MRRCVSAAQTGSSWWRAALVNSAPWSSAGWHRSAHAGKHVKSQDFSPMPLHTAVPAPLPCAACDCPAMPQMQHGKLETMRLYASLRTGFDFGMPPRKTCACVVAEVAFLGCIFTMLIIASSACWLWLSGQFGGLFSAPFMLVLKLLFLRLNGARFRGAPRFTALPRSSLHPPTGAHRAAPRRCLRTTHG